MTFVDFLFNLFEFESFVIVESITIMTIFLYHFHGRMIKNKMGEYHAYQIHFLSVFVLFMIIPLVTLVIYGKQPLDFGLKIGDWQNGLLWVGGGLALAVVVGLFSSAMPDMRKQYPFSKEAMESPRKFIRFELMYLLFYYTGWEFMFRGFLLFSLAAINPMIGILAQIIPSTLLHINHPESENWGALLGGILFGFIAYSTGSILYTWIIHAGMGIILDTCIFIRNRKEGRANGH